MWEYERFEIKDNSTTGVVDKLNLIGADGWDIIYYEENKPQKFGDNWIIIILTKRLKTSM